MNEFCLSAGQSEKKAMNERGGKNDEGGTSGAKCFLLKIILVVAAFVGISGTTKATPTLYISTTGLPGSYTAVAANAV